MHRLFSLVALLLVANLVKVKKCNAVPNERVKRQNIQAIVIPKGLQNINFEKYMKNPRAVQYQLKCLIYDGPCDSIGKYLKAHFPSWLSTQCRNCNPELKKQAAKAIAFFQTNYPKEWNDGVKKYKGNFTDEDVKRFESELGIKIEATVPAGGTPKPDTAGLTVMPPAKTTTEPLVTESLRSSTTSTKSVAGI